MMVHRKVFLLALLMACVRLFGQSDILIDEKSPSKLIPFSKTSYYHFAKDQSLSELIRDFFAMQGITVVVSDTVNYNVNGRFNKMDPAEFWEYITKAYGLIWFFDGKIMFVYSNSELQTQILKMDVDSIGTLSAIVNRLGFVASDFSFRGVGEANVLIVTAPPQYITVINDITSKFVPSKISDTTVVKVFPLKYAWAYDMSFNYANGSISVPGVASLLQGIVTGQSPTAAFSPFNVNVGSQKIQQQNMLGILDDTPNFAKNINKNIKNNVANNSANSKDNGNSENGLADISGTTLPGFITCDQRLNAIIIRDSRENMPFYEEIIKTLDVPCDVIKIDVAVVNVNKNKSFDLGLKDIKLDGKKVTMGMSNVNGNINSSGNISNTGSIGGAIKAISNLEIDLTLDALEANGNGETLARPSVLTLDNVAAILETDKTQYSSISGAYSSNAYSKTATTKLQVVPHIIPNEADKNGKRKMKLFVDISEGDFDNVAQGADSVVTQHSLNTQAVIYEGQSLLIGGYNTEVYKKEISGVPLLKDIPLIGMIFRHSSDVKTVKERVYVVSPSVVEIRSDDHKYDRFVQESDLSASGTLAPGEFSLKKKWPKEESSVPENSSEQNDVPAEKQLEATTNQTEKIENNEVKDRSSKVSTRVRERRRRQGR